MLAMEIHTDAVKNPPKEWADLLKPEYKGQIALAGDPRTVAQAIHFIVDVTGYYAPPSSGLYYHPLPYPIRLLDTRAGTPTCIARNAPLNGGSSYYL